jgi:hypothetical protein
MSGVIVPPEVYLGDLIRHRLEEAENRLKGSVLSKEKIELIESGEIVFVGGTKITSTEVEWSGNGKLTFGKLEIYVEGEETLIFQHGEKKFIVGLDEVKDDKDKEKEKEDEKREKKITEDT